MIDEYSRTSKPGWINLGIGEPVFLQKALEEVYPSGIGANICYPPSAGTPGLIKAIQSLPGNENKHVVVTNGATQALAAANACFNKEDVFARAPYWPRLSLILEQNGIRFREIPTDVEIITYPNNPNGCAKDYHISRTKNRIWDAAYNASVYYPPGCDMLPEVASDIQIYSASKMFGLSGLRVGWLTTTNDLFAKLAAEYVEIATSGVSILSQNVVEVMILKTLKFNKVYSFCIRDAKASLCHNSIIFNHRLSNYMDVIEGAPANQGGMFAWFKPKDDEKFKNALKNAKVTVISGETFGMPEFYRMNLGADSTDIDLACELLKKELK